jgi:hypothetical protein
MLTAVLEAEVDAYLARPQRHLVERMGVAAY